MILRCGNQSVYDIDTEKVINPALLPGYMRCHGSNNTTFRNWLKLRYSSNTNTLARQLKGVTFGHGNRLTIDKQTNAFGLSDSYWLADIDNTFSFESLSPYYSNFWRGEGGYNGGAIPTLYVSGYLSKQWLDADWLYKKENLIEVECSRLCHLCGIFCSEIKEAPNGGILVRNFTTPALMLEQADMSGVFDPDDYTDADILKAFGMQGFQMLLMDSIFGNGDRHLGNFGYMRDTFSGEYVGLSPLYDFDHALDSTLETDRLLVDVATLCANNKLYHIESSRCAEIVISNTNNLIFKKRATWLLNGFL